MTRDALYIEQMQIREEMNGISPKTEIYKRLKARLDELKGKSGGVTVLKSNLARLDTIWSVPVTEQRYLGKKPNKMKKKKPDYRSKITPMSKIGAVVENSPLRIEK